MVLLFEILHCLHICFLMDGWMQQPMLLFFSVGHKETNKQTFFFLFFFTVGFHMGSSGCSVMIPSVNTLALVVAPALIFAFCIMN